MLTVCPHAPDLNSLLFNVLDGNPDWITDDMVKEAKGVIHSEAMEVITGMSKTSKPLYSSMSFFDQCFEDGPTYGPRMGEENLVGSEECQLVLLLGSLAAPTAERNYQVGLNVTICFPSPLSSLYFLKGRHVVREYLNQKYSLGEKPSLESLKKFCQDKNTSVPENLNGSLNHDSLNGAMKFMLLSEMSFLYKYVQNVLWCVQLVN